MLNIASRESFFMVSNKYSSYGILLGAALANILVCSFESRWLQDPLNDLKPVFGRRYVHDIFSLFSSVDHAGQLGRIRYLKV